MTHDDTTSLSPTQTPPATAAAAGVPYLGFWLGADLYGVPLARLREVCRLTRLRRIPGAASHVAGLVNLRGQIICALDAREILGLDCPKPPGVGYLIALEHVSYPVGLVVDAIVDVFSIDPDSITAPPVEWSAERSACIDGLSIVGPGSIRLLDLDRVVNR